MIEWNPDYPEGALYQMADLGLIEQAYDPAAGGVTWQLTEVGRQKLQALIGSRKFLSDLGVKPADVQLFRKDDGEDTNNTSW